MSDTQELFVGLVHDALKHLYDSSYLQRHALTRCVSESSVPKSQELRRMLLDTIQALRPKPGVPAGATDWRAYRILELRYIEGLEPREVMEQVALSKSQYYREQDRVVGAVATILWDRFQSLWQEPTVNEHNADDAPLDVENTSRQSLARNEAETLSMQMEWESVNVSDLLAELCDSVEPLARAKQVKIEFDAGNVPWVRNADRVMMRQVVLNALTFGLDMAIGGSLSIQCIVGDDREEGIYIRAQGSTPTVGVRQEQRSRLGVGIEICRQLLAAMEGRLEIWDGIAGRWEAKLLWPATEKGALLVVDNNASFIDLFRRYLAHQTWNVIGATSTTAPRQILRDLKPVAIVLDVMMPKEDGWELLHTLRENAATSQIPVIICSVLNEPDLALTLGASAYLAKPVSQQALLATLAPWFPRNSILVSEH